jgi:purine-binding chemotaxis protein CheW
MSLNTSQFERNPPTLERHWAMFSSGIYRLDGRLLVILDVARLLDYAIQS